MTKDLATSAEGNRPFEWGSGEEADSIRTMSSQELSASITEMLKGRNLEEVRKNFPEKSRDFTDVYV